MIEIRIIVQKDGEIKVSQVHEGTPKDAYPEEVPYRGQLENSLKIEFQCKRYSVCVGRKEANTCKGCTIQCHMRGKYIGTPIEVKK